MLDLAGFPVQDEHARIIPAFGRAVCYEFGRKFVVEITEAVEHALDGFFDSGESAAGSGSSYELGDTTLESACSKEEEQLKKHVRNPRPYRSLGDEKLLVGKNSQEDETQKECGRHHASAKVHAS